MAPELGIPERIEVVGRLVQASNATFLVDAETPSGPRRCVYKPVAGERPLWDFTAGTLAAREVAAYQLSLGAGFDVVPPTIRLEEGPAGPGSLQLWIDHEGPEVVEVVPPKAVPKGWHPIIRGMDEQNRAVVLAHAEHPGLRRLALFDVIANNADRKGAHILVAPDSVFGVDQGLCFHEEHKLRTVLWGWAGEPLAESELELVRAAAAVAGTLTDLLAPVEVEALVARCDALTTAGTFPEPGDAWPVIPWPPM